MVLRTNPPAISNRRYNAEIAVCEVALIMSSAISRSNVDEVSTVAFGGRKMAATICKIAKDYLASLSFSVSCRTRAVSPEISPFCCLRKLVKSSR